MKKKMKEKSKPNDVFKFKYRVHCNISISRQFSMDDLDYENSQRVNGLTRVLLLLLLLLIVWANFLNTKNTHTHTKYRESAGECIEMRQCDNDYLVRFLVCNTCWIDMCVFYSVIQFRPATIVSIINRIRFIRWSSFNGWMVGPFSVERDVYCAKIIWETALTACRTHLVY